MTQVSHPGVVVRRVQPDEFEAAGDITVAAYAADGFAESPDYRALMRDVARRNAEAEVLVAVHEASGTVLGSVTFALAGRPWADIAEPGEAEFRQLGVGPGARGRGVGEALVRACVGRARAAGCERLVLSTQPSMQAAHRLYERLGFERAPERDWSPLPDVPLLVYVLTLR